MAKKLWQKNIIPLQEVEDFTVGNDRNFDLQLAPFDVLGSIAHIKMLKSIGLLSSDELSSLETGLKKILDQISNGSFAIDPGVEDIHSQIENLLTNSLGETGKKIHTARSRNDQVLLDIKLFLRSEIEQITIAIKDLFTLLLEKSEEHKNDYLPGYTHMQLAMPSSFGLWFGAYAESLADDVETLLGAWNVVNKNPLGSAAGFGSSFPINRQLTTDLLGFPQMNYNVVYAQMTRGKSEKVLAQSMSNIAQTLARLSMDAVLFLNQHFNFISFPENLTTGSSIMPHKKNPDVFELIRAHCNRIQSVPNEISLLLTNLTSGYHRDLQLLKEIIFPAIKNLKDCLAMTSLMIRNIEVKKGILNDDNFNNLFTVEEMNKLIISGMPMREAYGKIGEMVAENKFSTTKELNHTHAGSIGNLMNEDIRKNMEVLLAKFEFEKAGNALKELLK
ncbi:MAG: argininosuccinate lyase [Ginsengibacter sp.]